MGLTDCGRPWLSCDAQDLLWPTRTIKPGSALGGGDHPLERFDVPKNLRGIAAKGVELLQPRRPCTAQRTRIAGMRQGRFVRQHQIVIRRRQIPARADQRTAGGQGTGAPKALDAGGSARIRNAGIGLVRRREFWPFRSGCRKELGEPRGGRAITGIHGCVRRVASSMNRGRDRRLRRGGTFGRLPICQRSHAEDRSDPYQPGQSHPEQHFRRGALRCSSKRAARVGTAHQRGPLGRFATKAAPFRRHDIGTLVKQC